MNKDEIRQEIERLENSETSWGNCEKLAVLYAVMNGTEKETPAESRISYAEAPVSEFISVVKSIPIDVALSIIDRHMDAVKTIYPKEYEAVLDMMKNVL